MLSAKGKIDSPLANCMKSPGFIHQESPLVSKKKAPSKKKAVRTLDDDYGDALASMVDLLESARRLSARTVNSIMTATYWEIGRRIVELEQGGQGRAQYGQELMSQLAGDLKEAAAKGQIIKPGRAAPRPTHSPHLCKSVQPPLGLAAPGCVGWVPCARLAC